MKFKNILIGFGIGGIVIPSFLSMLQIVLLIILMGYDFAYNYSTSSLFLIVNRIIVISFGVIGAIIGGGIK